VGSFPFIHTVEQFKEDNAVLLERGEKTSTTLKAFGHAPTWTKEELQTFADVFESFGLKVTRFPKRSLKYNPNRRGFRFAY
jgi:hypothetical protein